MRFYLFLTGALASFSLAATAVSQETPAEVTEAYAAHESFAALEEWEHASGWALIAAEAGEAARLPAAERAELWEAAGFSHVQAGDLPTAREHLKTAEMLWRDSGNIEGQARVLRYLIELDFELRSPAEALENLELFETILTDNPDRFDQLERDVLSLLLFNYRRRGILISPSTEIDLQRIDRLDALTSEGEPGAIVVHYRRTLDLVAAEGWQDAEELLFTTLRAWHPESEDLPNLEAELFTLFSRILVGAYDDRDTAGLTHIPADLRDRWCAFLAESPPIIQHTQFAALSVLSDVAHGRVTLTYSVNAEGRIAEYSVSPGSSRARRRAERELSSIFEVWRWRPQCQPDPSYRSVNTMAVDVLNSRQWSVALSPMSMRHGLFYGAW